MDDRENARGLGITFFETEEDLRRGDRRSTRCRRLWTLARAVERRGLRGSPSQGTRVSSGPDAGQIVALDEKQRAPPGHLPRLLEGWERYSGWSRAELRSYAFAMRRICFTVVGTYLAVALLGATPWSGRGWRHATAERTVGANAPA